MDGKVLSFDLTTGEQVSDFQAATDTVNGFQFHPFLPLAATASGTIIYLHLMLPLPYHSDACVQLSV